MVLLIVIDFVSTNPYEEYFLQTRLCPRVLKFAVLLNSVDTGFNTSQISGNLSLTSLLEKCKWFKENSSIFWWQFFIFLGNSVQLRTWVHAYIYYSRELSERVHTIKNVVPGWLWQLTIQDIFSLLTPREGGLIIPRTILVLGKTV